MNIHNIQPLQADVVAKIKSSTSITHLNGVIVELVKNALDANAHSIFVTVDYKRGGCVVEDDGGGIWPAEFEPEGGLGKAHHTSKIGLETPVYGWRGSFLASLSALALLTITSHHAHHASTNTVMFHHSTPVARLTPAPIYQGLKFSDHGTRVTVNDLFGNMPVRVKNRALTLQKPDELDRQWDDLRYLLVLLMISNDSLLKLVILDTDKERKWTIRPRGQARDDGELDLTRFGSILSQAGLIDSHNVNIWHAVSASVPYLTIHAALSLVPSPSRKVQFISLGIDPVFPQSQTNILYSEVNRLFSLSDFGSAGDFLASTGNGIGTELDVHRAAKPLAKAVNKWPMFYIRIDSGSATIRSDNQVLPESDKSLQRILDILALMINEYLKEHNMRPRDGKRKRQVSVTQEAESTPEPGASGTHQLWVSSSEEFGKQLKLPPFSRPGASSHFGSWSRIKSAKSHSNSTDSHKKPSPQASIGAAMADNRSADVPMVTLEGQVLDSTVGVECFQPVEKETSVNLPVLKDNSETDTVIPWVDPHTGIRHWINSRTGQSVNVRPSVASLFNRPKSTGSLMITRVLDSTKRPASAIPQGQNMWLENLLDNWKNPVFGRTERPINALDTGHDYDTSAEAFGHSFHKLCGLDSFGVSRYRGKLRKQDLATAKVIGQVDRKFILVEMLSRGHPSTLVLIDQHAADERCRIESLFEEFFSGFSRSVQTMQVDPVIFEIPTSEAFLFKRHAQFFRSWGVEYTVEQDAANNNASVSVSQLPTLIAERCRTEPDLITGIIRGEIWKLAENGTTRSPAPAGISEQSEDWVGRLAGCPRGILDLLNSRACRTAIMFNDVLSIDDCRNLVRRLSTCVFPFQCAHGRPSMVPLVDLRGTSGYHTVDGGEGTSEVKDVGFVEAFKRWQSR